MGVSDFDRREKSRASKSGTIPHHIFFSVTHSCSTLPTAPALQSGSSSSVSNSSGSSSAVLWEHSPWGYTRAAVAPSVPRARAANSPRVTITINAHAWYYAAAAPAN